MSLEQEFVLQIAELTVNYYSHTDIIYVPLKYFNHCNPWLFNFYI